MVWVACPWNHIRKYYDKVRVLFLWPKKQRRKRRKYTKTGSLLLYCNFFQNEKTSVTEQARAEITMQIFLPPSPQKQKNHSERFPSKMLAQITRIIPPVLLTGSSTNPACCLFGWTTEFVKTSRLLLAQLKSN